MTKRLVEIDDAVLRAARDARGYKTIKDTVDAGLRELASAEARTREIDRLLSGYLEPLADKKARLEPWR